MVPWLWFILIFLHLIRSAAGTLFLSLPDAHFPLNTNVTLTWRRQLQDPQRFLLQTRPPSFLENNDVDARNENGTVGLVFRSLGAFALQAVDPNNLDNLLQETPMFFVEMARDPTTTPTSTKVFNSTGIITIIQTHSSTPVVTSTQTTIIDEPTTSATSLRAASRPNVAGIVAGAVCGFLLLILIVVILLYYIPKRRREKVRRHTFHPEMMTEGTTTPVVIYKPGEVYHHRGSSFEILSRVSPSPAAYAASPSDMTGSSNNWVARRPNQPYSPFVNDSQRTLTSPLVEPLSEIPQGRTVLDVPPINTQRLNRPVSGSDEPDPLTARTSVSSNTAEMRAKMKEALDKMRMMRRSGQQQQLQPRLDPTN